MVLVFALLGIAVLVGFVLVGEPPARQPRGEVRATCPTNALESALGRHAFHSYFRSIMAFGSRVTGQPGCDQTESVISNAFQRAGLDIVTQEFPVTVPETEVCEIRDAKTGEPLPGVRLFPFAPSGLMPISCSFTTLLVGVESAALRCLAGCDVRRVTPVTSVEGGGSWQELAGAGVPALIVCPDPEQRALRPSPDLAANWDLLMPGTETPFPRLYATGPILSCTGRAVTVTCRVVWREKKGRNIVGRLPGRAPGSEALVLTAYYDSSSVVPEQAPGAEQAVPVSVLLDLAESLAPYRQTLPRDIIFVATAGHAQGLAGVSRLMECVERFSEKRPDAVPFEARRAFHENALRQPDEALLGRIAAGERHLAARETVLSSRLAYMRAGSPVYRDGFDAARATDAERKAPGNAHPLLTAYLEAKRLESEAAAKVALPVDRLLALPGYRAAYNEVGDTTRVWHEAQVREWTDRIRIRDLFAPYRNVVAINLELNSGGSKQLDTLSLLTGIRQVGPFVEPQCTDIANLLMEKTTGLSVLSWGARDADGSVAVPNRNSPWMTELESEAWVHCGRLAFSVCNHGFISRKIGTPEDVADGIAFSVLDKHVPAVARLALAMAGGQVEFKTLSAAKSRAVADVHGRVYGEAGISTLVPSHPMGVRSVVRVMTDDAVSLCANRGIDIYPVITCDPYGGYSRPIAFDLAGWTRVAVQAARFDAGGHLLYASDHGPASQGVFPCVDLGVKNLLATAGKTPRAVNVGVFRAAPVTIYPPVNPQTQKVFKGIRFLSQQGWVGPARFHTGPLTTCLEPDLVFDVALLDGAADNPQILTPRAFMLNVDPFAAVGPGEPDLASRGYLAADTPLLAWPQLDAAGSMLRTGGKRLDLQRRFKMADEQMLGFHEQGERCVQDARRKLEDRQPLDAANAADAGLAYAMANHPVIRGRISQAVVGILWYLGLLVPFVFFSEKLLFGFTDIRKQLLAILVIFLVVFMLLRVFHPAFEMVRSSLMILLGFIILLLTLLVTLMVGGKFKDNLKELRRREGQVDGADVNRGGVIGTAFMLGLNNMRRRKVRTGLTCATLILITFVMICFTSVSTDLADVEYSTGRSSWNGIMVRDDNYRTLDESQVNALRRIYGEHYPVAMVRWLVPSLTESPDRVQNTELQVDRVWRDAGLAMSRRVTLNSALEMDWREPEFSGIDAALLTHRGWFPRAPVTAAEIARAAQAGQRGHTYVILPEPAARELGITAEMVDASNAVVNVRGEDYEVLGLFDPDKVARLQGLDGRSLLPFDLNSVQQFGSREHKLVVPEDVGRLAPSQVMIVNRMPPLRNEEVVTAYCSILFPRTSYRLRADSPVQPPVEYREQRRLVTDYLERLGKPAYYAVDGTAYYGSRQRVRTLAGLLQLIVPLLIAGLTVFNTMRGSVFERRGEIYVYNAVGIAPNHVFFMFMAEACVYAVVGAVCGYVLSQAMGRILTALGLTGGLNMDYSSIETIYASLAIMVAVLLSTLLPARDAARMASPSGMTGWTLPPAVNDTMEFDLPFTFTAHDRIAVTGYFRRWLEANGEGSSGLFYCSAPDAVLRGGGSLIPALQSTVWLKPYDLGVSQVLEISLPVDNETGEYIAHIHITRLSGHTAAWQRTIKPFLGSLRKQFLSWRAISAADRAALFAEASQMLRTQAQREDAHVGT